MINRERLMRGDTQIVKPLPNERLRNTESGRNRNLDF